MSKKQDFLVSGLWVSPEGATAPVVRLTVHGLKRTRVKFREEKSEPIWPNLQDRTSKTHFSQRREILQDVFSLFRLLYLVWLLPESVLQENIRVLVLRRSVACYNSRLRQRSPSLHAGVLCTRHTIISLSKPQGSEIWGLCIITIKNDSGSDPSDLSCLPALISSLPGIGQNSSHTVVIWYL